MIVWMMLSYGLGVLCGITLMCVLQINRVNKRRQEDAINQKKMRH